MKEKRKEKDFISDKQKKKKKKHKKKYDSSASNDSDSNGEHLEWVEASPVHNTSTKKKRKHKKKSYKSSSSSDSEASSDKYSKTESFSTNTDKEKRDSWMNEESFVPTLSKTEMLHSSSRQRRLDSMREQEEKNQKIQEMRELNPHWKNDGTGLPNKEGNVDSLSLPSTSVGDGGYSWLKKAYYRIQEQAQCEGRSMEEVAVERWGSLKKLTSLIEEAEERMKSHPDWRPSRNRKSDKYDYDKKSNRARFIKPSDSHQSERNFDGLFQFRKPSNDFKNSKVLNQFKSSRKSNLSSYSQLDKRAEYRNSDKEYLKEEQSSKYEEQNYDNDKKNNADSGNHTPAWKKPKYFVERKEETEVLKDSSPGTSHQTKGNVSEIDNIPIICSEEDLSKLAAKQIKAEIMGDTALALKLKEQLDEARKIVQEKGFSKESSKRVEEEVILTKLDNHGLARPIHTTEEKIADYKQKKSVKYFDDGSKYSLKQMFEREKLTTIDDQMEMFVEASAQCNETAELDYESGKISKKLSQKLASNQEDKDIGKAIQQHQKHTASLERCEYCLDQPRMKKHLLVDIGQEVYLCLPNYQTLTKGHCLIVPKMHVSSLLSLDENEWREVNDFKSQLRNLFRSENKSVIFLETSMNFRYFPHAVLECIPVPEVEGDMAPFYFKKAIQESEAEWAHNKKLIDLTKKGLRYSVPKNLPYFHVEFDPKVHAGYAHVIEEEKYFPRNFGKEVVGGMLDIDYNYLYKNKKEDALKKSKEVVEFEKIWKKFKNVES